MQQFPLLEEALEALGVVVWPMIELEADDALASAAALAVSPAQQPVGDANVGRVLICTPDKDLAQCVRGDRVVQFDRRKRLVLDEAAVIEKYGVAPASIPDYLALVGDSADGFPGLPGWGARTAAAVLARWHHIDAIPPDPISWGVPLRGADRLSAALEEQRDLAYLFRDLATLRTNEPLFESVEALRWPGPTPAFEEMSRGLESRELWERARRATARPEVDFRPPYAATN
jgi:5'-3' exonuclease